MFQIILFALTGVFSDADSLRMETINGKAFVIHQVGEKETLYGLARRYGATTLEIVENNPSASGGGLEVGQILKIPYTKKAKAQVPVQTSGGLMHKVVTGETLFSISRQYSVTVDDIKAWNNLKDNSISLGQDLIVAKKTVPSEIKTIPQSTAKTHTVAARETLFSISRQYGMTVQQLKEWNNLQSDELKLGQVLAVSAPASVVTTVPETGTPVTVTPIVTNPVVTTTTTSTQSVIRISEGVAGSDEMKEIGIAELIEGTQGNRKYLAQHKTIKPGTILKVRNMNNNQEVFVRVIGPIVNSKDQTAIICVSKSAFDRLGAAENSFKAEITYYK